MIMHNYIKVRINFEDLTSTVVYVHESHEDLDAAVTNWVHEVYNPAANGSAALRITGYHIITHEVQLAPTFSIIPSPWEDLVTPGSNQVDEIVTNDFGAAQGADPPAARHQSDPCTDRTGQCPTLGSEHRGAGAGHVPKIKAASSKQYAGAAHTTKVFSPNGVVTYETCPCCHHPYVKVEHGHASRLTFGEDGEVLEDKTLGFQHDEDCPGGIHLYNSDFVRALCFAIPDEAQRFALWADGRERKLWYFALDLYQPAKNVMVWEDEMPTYLWNDQPVPGWFYPPAPPNFGTVTVKVRPR